MRLCLDFDGVISKYPGGELVPGAIEFIRLALDKCSELSIFSTRSSQGEAGISYMAQFLLSHGLDLSDCNKIAWYSYKPPALVFIDDRAWRFEGVWPDLEELRNFKTWEEK